MNEEVLPPSPNWFLSNVLTHLGDSTIGYGARNCIIIAKFVSANQTPDISTIHSAHKDKVSVIAASQTTDVGSTFWHCLASAGDDSLVKVWNWDTLTPLVAHNAHVEATKVTALDWSKLDLNLVVSADEQGTIVAWDLFSNTTQKFSFAKLTPTCLSCCPHRRELVAVGTRSGLVCTISLRGGKMLHRLRGHDSEVVSLVWCPVLQPKNMQEDVLLASGAKERTIFIWKAGGDGRYKMVLHLPTAPLVQEAPGSHKNRSRLGPSTGAAAGVGGGGWTCVSWPEPNTLLCSSLFGELVACDLEQALALKSSKPAVAAKVWKLVHACHSRGLFNIAHGSWGTADEDGPLDGDESSPENKRQMIWTTAQDRQIVLFDWKREKVVASVPTLGGFVYCLAPSPLDSNRIAIGVGDGVIRVWNLSNSSSLEVTCFWQKIKGKVMALAWHPSREGWLAYGTSEGRIGIYDVSCGKPPFLFRPYHRRNVYSLCWGPPVLEPGEEHGTSKKWLYSCGDGDVIAYDPETPNEEPFSLKEVPPQKNIVKTDIAWKPDYSLLAVGYEDGTINLLAAPQLKPVQTLFAHNKLIQCMAWHPESTATDTAYSPYQHWLATTSNEAHIKVFDLSPLMEDLETVQARPLESCISLSGHMSRVVSLAWSSHIGGQLVSVSYDFTAQIWNVPAQQPVASFSAHSNHLYCCAWSPLDPDIVITGSADYTLRVWKVSKQTLVLPTEKKKHKKMEGNSSVKMAEEASSREGNEKTSADEELRHVEFAKNEKEVCEATVTKRKKTTRKSFFPVSSSLHSQGKAQHLDNCYQLLAALDNEGTKLPPYLGFFCGRDAMLRLLDTEVQQHVSDNNLEMAQHMELWKGNISEMLRESARQKKLSDWLVSLAPMASQRLWMEMCKAYADQLKVCGQFQKAASYLLVCHKVNEAIDLLVEHQLFREALAIARCRLGPDDPMPKKVVLAWARHVTLEGHYELAVECLISIGELMEAAMLIRKRNDEGSLKLAALIARKAGSQELSGMLASQSLKQSLIVGNDCTAREVAEQHPELKHLKLMVTVHDVVRELAATKKSFDFSNWLRECKNLTSMEKSILEEISSRLGCDVSEEEQSEIYCSTKKDFGNYESPDSIHKVRFVMSTELALASMSASEVSLHHVVVALNACYQFTQLQPLRPQNLVLELCMWLAPQGPFSSMSIFCSDVGITRSLRAYLCVGVVEWLLSANGTSPSCELVEIVKTCMKDVLTKESSQYFEDCVNIKKWEQEVASAVAKMRKGDAADDDKLLKLEELKLHKMEFEQKYSSSPNPFITYCKIKNLLAQNESMCEDGSLNTMLEGLWKDVTALQRCVE